MIVGHSYENFSMLPRAVMIAFVCGLVAVKSIVSWAASLENRAGGIRLDYRMTEELPAGTRIGNLAVDANLTVEHGHPEAGSYRYSIVPSVLREYFDIEAGGGLLKTSAKSFDRDVLCGDRGDCVATLDVYVAQGLGAFQLVKVRISVEDLNDNTPLFQPDRLSLFVSESALPGTTFSISAASDPDFGEFGIRGYKLDGDRSRFFRLDTSPTAHVRQLRLVLQEKLDRESENGLRLRITAVDGGTPPRTGVLTVDVVVQDANDNSPVFLERIYAIEVDEAKTFQGPLLRVSATDPDEGDNGRVLYDFDKATLASFGSDFALGNVTGEIFLRRSLDFERRSSYELVVMAIDMGLGSLPGSATVIVTVGDVNDNAPEIYVWADTLRPTSEEAKKKDREDTFHWVSVPENQSSDAFIAQIFVTDQDTRENGEVFCSTGSDGFHLQKELDALPGLFKLTASVPLDRETRPEFTVVIECADRGNPPLRSRETMTVCLIDINDNEPRFTESEYFAELPEGSGSGVSILTVTAVDRDLEENGRVSYHLQGNLSGELVIDRYTGVIRTGLSPVDRETAESLIFSVVATDHGTPNLTAAILAQVKIIDVNDEAPRFFEASYSFSCAENLPPGTWVGTVYALDLDQPPFDAFLYSIAPTSGLVPASILRGDKHEPVVTRANDRHMTELLQGARNSTQSSVKFSNSKEIPFEINKTTGRISMTRTLDREWQSSYSFIVVATDVGSPYLSSEVGVRVRVTDVNDNAPVIQSLIPDANVVVLLDTAVDLTVLRVAAADADDALNSKVHYSIVYGNHDDLFYIDPDNGDIRLARAPPSMNWNESYSLLVLVSDGGQPRLTATTRVTLTFSQRRSEGAPISLGVPLLRHNETVLLVVLGVTFCVIAILIVAISYTKRLQLEEARAKQARYFDVKTAIMGFESSQSRTGSSVCTETPSPLLISDHDRSRSSCLEESDTRELTENSSKTDPVRACCIAGDKSMQLRSKVAKPRSIEIRHLMLRPETEKDPELHFHSSFSVLPSQTASGKNHSSSRCPFSSSSRIPGSTSMTSAGIPRPRSSPGIRSKSGEDFLSNGLQKQRLSHGGCLPVADHPAAPAHPLRCNHQQDRFRSSATMLFHLENGNETNLGMQKPSYSNNNNSITGNLRWNSNSDNDTLTSVIVPSWV